MSTKNKTHKKGSNYIANFVQWVKDNPVETVTSIAALLAARFGINWMFSTKTTTANPAKDTPKHSKQQKLEILKKLNDLLKPKSTPQDDDSDDSDSHPGAMFATPTSGAGTLLMRPGANDALLQRAAAAIEEQTEQADSTPSIGILLDETGATATITDFYNSMTFQVQVSELVQYPHIQSAIEAATDGHNVITVNADGTHETSILTQGPSEDVHNDDSTPSSKASTKAEEEEKEDQPDDEAARDRDDTSTREGTRSRNNDNEGQPDDDDAGEDESTSSGKASKRAEEEERPGDEAAREDDEEQPGDGDDDASMLRQPSYIGDAEDDDGHIPGAAAHESAE